MESYEKCLSGKSAPISILEALPESQKGHGRHKCTICAYANGYAQNHYTGDIEKCPHGNYAPVVMLDELPESQAGTGRHKCCICAYTHGIQGHMDTKSSIETQFNEQTDFPKEEGAPRESLVTTYERDPKLRINALIIHGKSCYVCGMDFNSRYGHEYAKGYIEIHHKTPISQGKRVVDPKTDLVPLCANCHRIVHRISGKVLDVNILKNHMQQ